MADSGQHIEVVELGNSSRSEMSALPLRERLKKLNIIQLQRELRNFGTNVKITGNKEILVERLAHLVERGTDQSTTDQSNGIRFLSLNEQNF